MGFASKLHMDRIGIGLGSGLNREGKKKKNGIAHATTVWISALEIEVEVVNAVSDVEFEIHNATCACTMY